VADTNKAINFLN